MLEQRLHALVPHWDMARVESIRHLPRGLSNNNFSLVYEGVGYVFRIGRKGFRANPAEAEAWQCSGLALPELVAADYPRGDLLTRQVDAPCLAEVKPRLEELGGFLRALHSALPPSFCSDYHLDAAIQSNGIARNDALPAWVWHRIRHLPPLEFVKEACHNDLNAWNILAREPRPGGWMAIDWEWAGNNSRLFDAVNLALFVGFDSNDAYRLAEQCGYQDAARYGDFQQIVERYHLRECVFAAAELATGDDSPYLREQLDKCLSALSDLPQAVHAG